MKATIRSKLLTFLSVTLLGIGSCKLLAANPPGIELRLSAAVTERHVGDPPIRVRVELWNGGKDDFIAGDEFAPILNAPSYVNLEFVDEKGMLHEGAVINSNFTGDAKSQSWTRIAPRHYYGEEFDLDIDSYPFLNTPGLFKVTAKYVSKGGDVGGKGESLICCHAWAGEVVSNTIMINVLPAESHR